MPTQPSMTWNKKQRTWYKKRDCKQYAVSCRQLRKQLPSLYQGDTEESSRRAANEWWRRKEAALDHAAAKGQSAEVEALWASHYEQTLRSFQQLAANPQDPGTQLASLRTFLGASPITSGQTIGQVKAEFLSAMHARVGVEIVAGHYAQLVRRVNAFVAFAGDSTPINAIDGNVLARYVEHLCNQVKKGHSTVYANVQLTSVKQFIRWAYKTEKLDKLPRELSSYSIEVKKSPVKTFTPEQVKGLLTSGITDRTKLFILLGLNCGMTQIDVSDLQQSEVNWTAGTITRKRSKTEKWETVPTVSYPLWADTFRLLINFRSNHKTLVLTTGSGKPMVTSELVAGREKKTDTIQKAWRQIKTSCKTLAYKHLRKTSATLLAGHRDFATVADLFLGHSPKTVSEIHYKKAPLELLADAVRWLGEVYGV